MLQRGDLQTLHHQRGYQFTEAVEGVLPDRRNMSTELALSILLHNGMKEDAVNMLCYAIVPRVGVWWAYLCLKMVMEDIEKEQAKDGLTPRERFLKEQKELANKLSDTSDIQAMVEERKKQLDAQVAELKKLAGEQNYLNPVERLKLKLAWIQREFAAFEQSLPPGSLGNPNDPPVMQDLIDSLTQSANSDFQNYLEHMAAVQQARVNISQTPDPIFETVQQKTSAVKSAIDEMLSKYFPLKIKGLPQRPTPAKKNKAVESVLRWILVPSDDNGKLACEAAMAAQDGPEAMLAYSAFWSSTNLKTDTGMAPTNMGLPPLGISKTLLQLALLEGGEMDYDKRYEEFLHIGIECADGTCTWDEYGHPVRAVVERKQVRDDSIFKSRFGFARRDTDTML